MLSAIPGGRRWVDINLFYYCESLLGVEQEVGTKSDLTCVV